MTAGAIASPPDAVLDLLEWLADGGRPYPEVMSGWRTSCPRLSVWEDALAIGVVRCVREPGTAAERVVLTPEGRRLLGERRGGGAAAPAERRGRPGRSDASLPVRATSGGDMKESGSTEGRSASELIDQRIADLGDWRGETLRRVRSLIREADPEVVEEWKWKGTPVWSHDGVVCTGESYASKVKLTFLKGASLDDPAGLFNSSLEGNARRAIDIHEGERIDADAFKALIRAAVALNASGARRRPGRAR